MKRLLVCLLITLTFAAARSAAASMDSALFLFTEKDSDAVTIIATGIWTDQSADSAAISERLRYPLAAAVYKKLKEGADGAKWQELQAIEHSPPTFLTRVTNSATVGFFKSASMGTDEVSIELSRHDGTKAIPYKKFSAKVSELLKMDGNELGRYIDDAASQIVAGWRSAK